MTSAARSHLVPDTLYTRWPSPLGELLLVGDERTLRAIHLPGRHPNPRGWASATEARTPWLPEP